MSNKAYRERLIKRTFALSKTTLTLVDKFPQKQSSKVIVGQLFRAITSIAANIVEAQAASSKKDFINFLTHALKSANESKFWLMLSKELDSKLISEIDIVLSETDEVSRILGSTISTLKGKRKL